MFVYFPDPRRDKQCPASGVSRCLVNLLIDRNTQLYDRRHVLFIICALQPTPQMQAAPGKVVYRDFGAGVHTLGEDRERNWTYGLMDCFGRCGLCT